MHRPLFAHCRVTCCTCVTTVTRMVTLACVATHSFLPKQPGLPPNVRILSVCSPQGRRASAKLPKTKEKASQLPETVSATEVAAVRLMRIEIGGAFTHLLNYSGRNSSERETCYVQRTLGFRTRDLSDTDLRQVTNVVGGIIRWRKYLDHLIASLFHKERAFKKLEHLLLQILRIGFYEIVKLDMAPYSVVNECVKLAKAALRPGAGNLANGILRKLVLKDSSGLPFPKADGDCRSLALATLYSHPDWMVDRWIKSLGQEQAINLMLWNNREPCFCLRVNTSNGFTRADLSEKLDMLQVPHEISLHLDDFIRVKTGMQVVVQTGLLKHGLCSVQDESAGLVISIVDPRPGDKIIDCCAAPGGKTLYMATLLRDQGTVFAIDINKQKLGTVKKATVAHGTNRVVSTIHADLRKYASGNKNLADKVLLDVPCSGLGVLSKRPDLRWKRKMEDISDLTTLQDELLDAAAMLVKPGGILVYSTCSIDPEENEDRVAAFLQRHPEYGIDPVHKFVPSQFVTDFGFFSSNPVQHSMDGAFAARLIRSS